MLAEFEERQFEGALNHELAGPARLVFVPGQVFESAIGIDAALWSGHPLFWSGLGHPSRPAGRTLGREIWREVERSLERFPPIQCNVFLQHKRPEFLSRRNSRQWPLWGRSYYRYETMAHQHATLERLEADVGKEGVVLYSAPAFHSFDDLWRHANAGSLVDNFNFAQPSRLRGHSVYTYVRPGTAGRPNPDGEDVKSVHPRTVIEHFRGEARDGMTPKEFILKTAEIVRLAVQREHGRLRRAFDSIVQTVDAGGRLAQAFVVMRAFCTVYSVSWFLPTKSE